MKTRLFAVAHFTAALLSAMAFVVVLSIATAVVQPILAASSDSQGRGAQSAAAVANMTETAMAG